METPEGDRTYRVRNIIADKFVKFHIRLSIAETEVTAWSLADTECFTGQLEREIYHVAINEWKWYRKALSIYLIENEASWKKFSIQRLYNAI